jgi:hypothetical protein
VAIAAAATVFLRDVYVSGCATALLLAPPSGGGEALAGPPPAAASHVIKAIETTKMLQR